MTTAKQIREPRADYLVLEEPALLRGFELLATAEGSVAKLRELILSLAVQGKLVRQDPSDESATLLLQRIAKEAGRPHTTLLTSAVPQGWVATTFGEYTQALCTGPFGSLIAKNEYIEGGIPLVNPSHMKNGRIEAQAGISVSAAKANELKAYALQSGDIVFARRGDVGRTAVVSDKEDGWLCGTGSFFARFHPDVDRAFIQMIFNSTVMRSYLGAAAIGTTMVNLNQRVLLNAPLHIPPLAEQHRIVARVEELMALCDELEARGRLADEQHARLTTTLFDALTASDSAQTLADSWQRIATHFDLLLDRPQAIDALEQTILQLAVRGLLVPQDASDEPASKLLARIRAEKDRLIADGKIKHNNPQPGLTEAAIPSDIPGSWEWARLGDVVELISGQHLTPNEYSEQPDSGIPYLTGPAEFGAASPDPTRWTTTRRAVAKRGDILITVKGAGVGKLNTVSQPELAISRQLMAIRPSGLLPAFIFLFLKTMYATFQAKAVGIAIPGIGRDDVLNAALAIPPLAEQHRIVARVEHLRCLCADLRERLNQSCDTQTGLANALVANAVQS